MQTTYHRVRVQLGKRDRKQIAEMLNKGRESARVLQRALILRQLDQGQTAAQVASRLGVAPKTVRAIARRYEEEGLEPALYEKPRPGQPRVLDAGQSQRIIAMVCSQPPDGRARWSVRLIAQEAVKRKVGPPVGRETIRILLRDHDLKPWREKNVMRGLDEEYIARTEDVLALYEKPLSEEEPVVCIDEKPVVLHAGLRPPRPMYPGRTLRRDSEYERRGTVNAFCGVEPKAGRHYPCVTPDRSSPAFADYLLEIAEHYPAADTIHLVLDNLSSHSRKAVVERYGEKAGGWLWDRFTVHYTPKHGSWLNQAEIEISLFSRQCLGQRRIPSLGDLRRETRAWGRRMNRDRVTIDWRFTRKQARLKFGYKRNHITRSRY